MKLKPSLLTRLVIIVISLGQTAHMRAETLYLVAGVANTIGKVSDKGKLSPLCTLGSEGGVEGKFHTPTGIAIDSKGVLTVADRSPKGNKIDKVTVEGKVSTFVDLPKDCEPCGLVFDASENLYVGEFGSGKIRKITPAGEVSVFSTIPKTGRDAPTIYALVFDKEGMLLVGDGHSNVIYKIKPSGEATVHAKVRGGSGVTGLVFDSHGTLFAADANTCKITKITGDGVQTAFASLPFGSSPYGLTYDQMGNMYAAGKAKLHKITTLGAVIIYATGIGWPYHIAFGQ